MKALLRITFALLFFIFAFACGDEQELDETPPEITLISAGGEEFVQDVITISASAKDQEGKVVSMEIYVDGILIHAEASDVIRYELNTADYADDEHTIKIIARNKAGHEAALEKKILVINTLMTFNIIRNTPEALHEYFYYLVDEDGAMVDDYFVQVVKGSTAIKFSTPINHAMNKKYALAYLETTTGTSNAPTKFNMKIITGFMAGTYNLSVGANPHEYWLSDKPSGVHTFNFTFGFTVPAAYHTDNYGQFVSQVDNALQARMNDNNVNTFLAIRPDMAAGPVFRKFTGLAPSSSTEIASLAGFFPMNGVSVPAPEGVLNSSSFVFGVKPSDEALDIVPVWSHDPTIPPYTNAFEMYYPGILFNNYYSGMIGVQRDVKDEFYSIAPVPPSSMTLMSANLNSYSKTNNIITVQSTGEYDLLVVAGATENFSWSIYLPHDNNLTYTIPPLPAQLIQKNVPSPSTWGGSVEVSIIDWNGSVVGYQDYIGKIQRTGREYNNIEAWIGSSTQLVRRTRWF